MTDPAPEPSLGNPKDHPLAPLARRLTSARVFAPRKGASLSTSDWLTLRADHAAARDAVFESVDLLRDFGKARIDQLGLIEINSQASSRADYLLHPESGRLIHSPDRERVTRDCPAGRDFQIILGDGLSATALIRQGPPLLDRLITLASAKGWSLGRPILIHGARVGLLNEVGLLLDPEIVVLLIGERPGLSTADSLSAYMAFRPRPGDTDARRNLISNIHPKGVLVEEAATRIIALAESMRSAGQSGVAIKEDFSGQRLGNRPLGLDH